MKTAKKHTTAAAITDAPPPTVCNLTIAELTEILQNLLDTRADKRQIVIINVNTNYGIITGTNSGAITQNPRTIGNNNTFSEALAQSDSNAINNSQIAGQHSTQAKI